MRWIVVQAITNAEFLGAVAPVSPHGSGRSSVDVRPPSTLPPVRAAVVMPVATQRGGAEITLLHALRHGGQSARWLVVFLEDGPMVDEVRSLGAHPVVVSAGRVRQLSRFAHATRHLGAEVRALGSWSRAQSVSDPL
jgi:hypothetical protein